MKIKIRAFGELAEVLAKHSMLELDDGENLDGLIDKLERIGTKTGKPLAAHRLRDSTLTILINGNNVRALEGSKTILKDGDTVTFIPLVEGG